MMDGCENIVPHHHNLITYTHIRQPTKIPSSVHSLCLCPSCPTLLYLIHLSLSLLSYSTWSTFRNPLLTAAHSYQTIMHQFPLSFSYTFCIMYIFSAILFTATNECHQWHGSLLHSFTLPYNSNLKSTLVTHCVIIVTLVSKHSGTFECWPLRFFYLLTILYVPPIC